MVGGTLAISLAGIGAARTAIECARTFYRLTTLAQTSPITPFTLPGRNPPNPGLRAGGSSRPSPGGKGSDVAIDTGAASLKSLTRTPDGIAITLIQR